MSVLVESIFALGLGQFDSQISQLGKRARWGCPVLFLECLRSEDSKLVFQTLTSSEIAPCRDATLKIN